MSEQSEAEMKHSIDRLTQELERLNTHRFVTVHSSTWPVSYTHLTLPTILLV